ncbi:hypothetical protein, partial [Staphylococcus aureus]|uniref:hypothetical protein n=1 Tax=Staphylococcus aureus TaxID=1280 RepID=UPI0038B2E2C0
RPTPPSKPEGSNLFGDNKNDQLRIGMDPMRGWSVVLRENVLGENASEDALRAPEIRDGNPDTLEKCSYQR